MTSGRRQFRAKSRPIPIHLSEEMWADIDRMAKEAKVSRNEMLIQIIDRGYIEKNLEYDRPFWPYVLIDIPDSYDRHLVIYERALGILVVVFVTDVDDVIELECSWHVGKTTCEHIRFAKQVPDIKEQIEEAKHELGH